MSEAISGSISPLGEIGVIQMVIAITIPDCATLHPGYACHARRP
jgi:hypothetical protein